MHSLRVKITAITIAAILASFAAFVIASYTILGDSVNAESAVTMHLLSENTQQGLDDYLDSIEQSVEMTSHIAIDSLDAVKLVDSGIEKEPDKRTEAQTQALDAYIGKHCAEVQEAFGSVASHTNGIVTYYYCINPEVSVAEHGFFYSAMGKAGFEEREPLDARELDRDDIGHTTWYYTPIDRGRPTWVGPYTAHFLDEVLTVSYLIPIYKAGSLIGVLGMDILFDTLVSQVSSIDVYDSGFACLLDAEGRVLYHPMLEMGSEVEYLPQELQDELRQRRSSGEELIRYKANGQQWQMSFSTPANGMKLVVAAPVREVIAPWLRLINSFVWIGLVILVVFIPVTLLAMSAVIKPLQRLTAAARKLSNGDYDAELSYMGNDEVGALTTSFRQMRDHLQVYISDLNSRAYVDALTGIKNKGAFTVYSARLNDLIRHAEDGQQSFALVMFDCNKLKDINDQFGHERGDVYLQTASHLICNVYAHSPVFRVGGDEFVALLQRHDYDIRDDLFVRFDQERDEVNDAASNPWERVDIAKGMAVYRPDEDQSVEEVLRRADERMYADKRRSH